MKNAYIQLVAEEAILFENFNVKWTILYLVFDPIVKCEHKLSKQLPWCYFTLKHTKLYFSTVRLKIISVIILFYNAMIHLIDSAMTM